jgi:hypothetical protein
MAVFHALTLASLLDGSPTPSPGASLDSIVSGAGEGMSLDLSGIGVPLIAALFGAVLTLIGEAIYRSFQDARAGKHMRDLLASEVEEIGRQASARSSSAGRIVLMPPLPTSVWEAFRASSYIKSIPADQLASLLAVYGAVDSANYLTGQVPLFTQVSALAASEDVARTYREEAQRLSTEPLAGLSALASNALHGMRGTKVPNEMQQ